VLETFLYQLRAFRNAGFKGVVAISGHAGGNQDDLRKVARVFSEAYPIDHFVCADPELVEGLFQGDHAGRYELSQLLAIRPELVDMSRAGRTTSDPLGRFAQNPDVSEASAALGVEILEASLRSVERVVKGFALESPPGGNTFISMDGMELLWASILADKGNWQTMNLRA
jgi:creatinine amidohydrolase